MENVKYIPGDLMEYITTGKICKLINISIDRDYIIEECDTHTRICTDIGRLSSIPLTPQILEANGWEIKIIKDNYFWSRVSTEEEMLKYKAVDNSIRRIAVKDKIVLTFFGSEPKLFYFEMFSNVMRIEFIHELQHLLFGLGLNSELKV